eukprot:TRINITY_DN65647_c8_g13_i1.p1 TRINITY_DN65647_c8_g13~~TRINITY_DN65647_c8_g13_i1.p1  ORF type:complete len:221 (+),score=56.47 TRINITY_DN65647_c8_g13_i1:100-762(+)
MWKWITGGGSKDPKPAPPPTTSSTGNNLAHLQDTMETLEKRMSVLEKRVKEETAQAVAAKNAGKKTVALTHLKRKKNYEEQVTKLNTQYANLQTMVDKIEEATLTADVLAAQKSGVNTLKQQNQKMNADQIGDQMADIQEALADFEEVTQAISTPLQEEDDDELLDELAAMEAEELEKELEGAKAGTNKLPVVENDTKVTVAAKTEDEELDALTAELNAA